MDIEGINSLARFLNSRNGNADPEMAMQILKLSEEAGEVARAWIGFTGQNPRKGFTHSHADVLNELADVAITAMVGVARLGGDPASVVGGKVAVMQERYAKLEVGDE